MPKYLFQVNYVGSSSDHRRSHPVDGLSCAAIVVSAAVVASAGV
jgi:hypothetical protein